MRRRTKLSQRRTRSLKPSCSVLLSPGLRCLRLLSLSLVFLTVTMSFLPLHNALAQSSKAQLSNFRVSKLQLKQLTFRDLPGWHRDDHQAAFEAYQRSCTKLMARELRIKARQKSDKAMLMTEPCRAMRRFTRPPDRHLSRRFFETYFTPYAIRNTKRKGILTGYYEPVLAGSRTRTPEYDVPVYRRPGDLVDLDGRRVKDKRVAGLRAARLAGDNLVPFPTRAQIDKGALVGKKLELLYLRDEVDLFFLQIQGSGRIKLADGSWMRIGFDGRNGHPYSSIGKEMIRRGLVPEAGMSLDAVKNWLRKNPGLAREIMWHNKSYIFFKEFTKKDRQAGPKGALDVVLTPGRSLAVDQRYHNLGLPIYVIAPTLRHHGENGFRRLMVAQDVGAAIKGPERGDIYWGSGDKAGAIAGRTKVQGQYIVLLPKRTK